MIMQNSKYNLFKVHKNVYLRPNLITNLTFSIMQLSFTLVWFEVMWWMGHPVDYLQVHFGIIRYFRQIVIRCSIYWSDLALTRAHKLVIAMIIVKQLLAYA